MKINKCHCGSEQAFSECCEPILNQQQLAHSAEQLMRSRFSAFKLQHNQWLAQSWDDSTKPANVNFENGLTWLDLNILNTSTEDGRHSTVEFEARYIKTGKVDAIHENSRFIQRDNHWFYVDGDYLKTTFKPFKLGRNELCLCGSKLKYKNCCAND